MFERFTERARQVVVLAQEEARTLNHGYIGTEHILLGLLREDGGSAARVLELLGITLEQARRQIVQIVGAGKEVTSGQIPFTPRAKKVLELALREALSLGHNYIGTEHILLGLARENEGVAAKILLDLGADQERIRNEVIQMLSGPGGRTRGSGQGAGSSSGQMDPGAGGWLEGLQPLLGRLTQEVRRELGRDPDPGDLLLVLGCAEHTLAGRALRDMSLDRDALWGTIEKLRQEDRRARDRQVHEIEELSRAKDQAIQEQRFEAAAQLRDQLRAIREGARVPPATALHEVRRRLGIPTPEEDAPQAPASD